MTNYTKGRRAEYLAIKELEEQGYKCVRSAGSHSVVDIVAFNAYEVKLIQIKKSRRKITYTKEREQLAILPTPSNIVKELWIRNNGNWLKLTL